MTENEKTIKIIKRLIGTSPSENIVSAVKDAINALEDVEQYRSIGTVEECQKAMEKQAEKNPKDRYKTKYNWDGAYCPVCNCGITARWNFCQNCGQAIDWSDRE